MNSHTLLPKIDGYSFENVDSTTSAGGVGIFIADDIDYIIRDDLNLNVGDCEDLWVEIQTKDHRGHKNYRENIVIGLIYRHPRTHYNKFSEALEKNLLVLGHKNKKAVILGDLNIDLMKFNIASKVTDYVQQLVSQGFNLCIDRPTRVTAHSATCIDHVYSNMPPEDIESIILESDVSDHFSTITKITGVCKQSKETDSYYRKTNLNPEQWEKFNAELQYRLACNLPSDPNNIDTNDYANEITNTYKTLIDEYMPLKKKSRKQKRFDKRPWLTKGIRVSIDRKDDLYSLSKIDPSLIPRYKKYSNMLAKIKKRAMLEYDKQKFAEYGHDKAKTWRYINAIMKRKRKARSSIKKIKNKDGKDIKDAEGIANCLNEHFTSIGKNMAQKFEESENLENPLDVRLFIQAC